MTPVVKNLLIINLLAYFALMSPASGPLMLKYLPSYYIDSPDFGVWQFITYAFLHSQYSIQHIFFNMLSLFMFGSTIENILGSKRFLSYYLITAISAIFINQAVNAIEIYSLVGTIFPFTNQTIITDPEVFSKVQSIFNSKVMGASGAVFGLLLAFGYLLPNAYVNLYFFIPIKAKYFVILYGALELYFAASNTHTNIAHVAHLGGLISGLVLLKLWGIRRIDYHG